jgi:hypothetical protein
MCIPLLDIFFYGSLLYLYYCIGMIVIDAVGGTGPDDKPRPPILPSRTTPTSAANRSGINRRWQL